MSVFEGDMIRMKANESEKEIVASRKQKQIDEHKKNTHNHRHSLKINFYVYTNRIYL